MKVEKLIANNQPADWFEKVTRECQSYPMDLVDIEADELVLNFFRIQDDVINHETTWHEAKQCALIAVDEIIYQYEVQLHQLGLKSIIKYWQEVKEEIKNYDITG